MGKFDPACYDYGEPLLSHAKVFHLAQSGAIYALRKLALGHLLDTLQRLGSIGPTSGDHTVAGICHLVRNVYASTAFVPIDPPEHQEEGLRSQISKFIACNFAALRTNPEMVKLLSEGGNIVMDVMGILSNGSVAFPSVPITPVAPHPAKLRSGPVARVVLPPVPSRPVTPHPAASPPVVTSIATLPTGLHPITLASVVLPPATSRRIALPVADMSTMRPTPSLEIRYISQLMVSKSPLRCGTGMYQFAERVYALGGKSGDISVGKDP